MFQIVAFHLSPDIEGNLEQVRCQTRERRQSRESEKAHRTFILISNATSTTQLSYKNQQRGMRQHRIYVLSPRIAQKQRNSKTFGKTQKPIS